MECCCTAARQLLTLKYVLEQTKATAAHGFGVTD